MERVKVNIRDTNFGFPEQTSSCHMGTNKFVEWVTDNASVSKACWFTDMCFPDVLKARPGAIKRKVAMVNEPRAIYPQVYEWIGQNNKLFDFVLTYDKEFLDRGENFLYYPHGRCWINNYQNDKKSKMCSIFASDKRTTIGHVLRHDVIARFKDKMDVFGRAYKSVEFKEEGMSEYYFSVTIENSVQEYYWTEKIVDCFATKTVPIFWGSRSVSEHFNEDGIIFFDTIDELEDILTNISTEQYEKMLPAIDENFAKVEEYRIPEDWMYQRYPFLFE
jgi:hypothetical protein